MKEKPDWHSVTVAVIFIVGLGAFWTWILFDLLPLFWLQFTLYVHRCC